MSTASRAIIVGDVHATASELEDCRRLIVGIQTLRDRADTVIFLGDQFHTHAIVHLDVVDFWVKAVRALQSVGFRVIMLVGNHDIETCGQLHPNALEVLEGTGVTVVDRPMTIGFPGVVAMPYIHDGEEFVRLANESAGPDTLICHQTFQGAQYDNGFYANDGIDQIRIPFSKIISGHIHSQATFGAVWYIGSPRWRTRDDANKVKSVVVYDFDTKSVVETVSTAAWCSPIASYELTPDSIEPESLPAGRVSVTLRGPADWVRDRGQHYKSLGCAVRQLPNVTAAPRVSESAPVEESFAKFLAGFRTPNGTPAETLRDMVRQCQSV